MSEIGERLIRAAKNARMDLSAMTDNVVQMRDFKRKDERKPITTADIVFRDGLPVGYVDTSPCEMPPVQPSYAPDKDSA